MTVISTEKYSHISEYLPTAFFSRCYFFDITHIHFSNPFMDEPGSNLKKIQSKVITPSTQRTQFFVAYHQDSFTFF